MRAPLTSNLSKTSPRPSTRGLPRLLLCAALALGAALPAQAGGHAERAKPPGAEPADTVRRFYAWVLAHPGQALPSAAQRQQLAQVLTPSLLQLLKTTSQTEARCLRDLAKGDKPDIVEGDVFVSHYEGATEVAYDEVQTEGDDQAIAQVQLTSIDTRFPKAHPHRAVVWRDTVVLRREGGRWWVQDVQFVDRPSLVASLNDYVEAGDRSCP